MQTNDTLTIVGLLALVAFSIWGVFALVGGRPRRRQHDLHEPFPAEWEKILLRYVGFYRALDNDDKQRFRDELRNFISEKRITGVKTEVDATTLVLAASSAIIPIFGFADWQWNQIREILIYPTPFSEEDFSMDEQEEHDTLGMVGSGAMNGVMILSKPDLIAGFRNPRDNQNVGIHEFVHLLDKADGVIDGVPGFGLDREAIQPWLALMHREMQRIRAGKSDIDPYGLTNEGEFFAVVSEYFFERPGLLHRDHPELYAMFEKIFRRRPRSSPS
jgi:Mlc titration factor MtfA (ptsG expression regulator)